MAETFTLASMETKLDEVFGKKAPQLPENVKEFIVKFGPYIALVMLLLSLPLILMAVGLGALVAPLALLGGDASVSFALIFLAVSLVLEGMAIPLLMKRSIKGWRLMFYSQLVNAVYGVLSGSLASVVVGTVIGLYFLFQVRSYYK